MRCEACQLDVADVIGHEHNHHAGAQTCWPTPPEPELVVQLAEKVERLEELAEDLPVVSLSGLPGLDPPE